MDTNIAAWMIGGGPQIANPHADRDRDQLHAFRESQRVADRERGGVIDRIRRLVGGTSAAAQLDCCTA